MVCPRVASTLRMAGGMLARLRGGKPAVGTERRSVGRLAEGSRLLRYVGIQHVSCAHRLENGVESPVFPPSGADLTVPIEAGRGSARKEHESGATWLQTRRPSSSGRLRKRRTKHARLMTDTSYAFPL
eukprot:5917041-Prymnesium_polylepis.1